MPKQKLIRITTVPVSLKTLLKGQHRFMSAYYEVIGVSSSGRELQEVAEVEKIQVTPVEMTRTISPLKDLKSVWLLYKLFKKEKPFVVHTHTPKAGTVGMLAAKLAGVPHRLHTIAGLPLLEVKGNKRRLLNVVEKATYACATNIYPNSKGLYTIILENKLAKADKLRVIGQGSSNGIDTSYFNPFLYSDDDKKLLKAKLSIEPEDFVFIFVGRLVGDKGINELVAAFRELDEGMGCGVRGARYEFRGARCGLFRSFATLEDDTRGAGRQGDGESERWGERGDRGDEEMGRGGWWKRGSETVTSWGLRE